MRADDMGSPDDHTSRPSHAYQFFTSPEYVDVDHECEPQRTE